ncbi:hypothetical protein [Conexibacter arvalis]|uniref:Uncharacterized protein n=1 Tax=Conexibacter arvalis TaxID=912552 RepID=A0A840IJG2_9ACTN|nr:hypothetical protein [Conexibacter arvalis]MBB4664475.1 hypothetical protein [Conexibacter arvalis]
MRHRSGGEEGQAANEYVALLAIVASVLVALVALSSGGVGSHVLAGIQRGLCAIAGSACPRAVVERDRLAACPIERRVSEERLSETIASVKLGSTGTLTAVRGSDGRVTVTLSDGSAAGIEGGAGAWVALGRRVGEEAKAGAALVWGSGRSWTFPDAAAAERFVARYGNKATMRGKLLDEVRAACSILCDALGWRPHPQLPEPDEVHAEGGAMATLSGAFGIGGGGDASAVVGRRVRRDGETTWYLRLSGKATAELGLPGAEAVTAAGGQALLSYRLDAAGRPLALGVTVAGEAAGRGALGGEGRRRAVRGGGKASSNRGGIVELEASLDLGDPDDRAAAAALLDALRSKPTALPRRAAALGARIVQRGQIDLRRYAVTTDGTRFGGELALGVKVGGSFERSTKGLTLLGAATRLPGLPFLARDDCRVA